MGAGVRSAEAILGPFMDPCISSTRTVIRETYHAECVVGGQLGRWRNRRMDKRMEFARHWARCLPATLGSKPDGLWGPAISGLLLLSRLSLHWPPSGWLIFRLLILWPPFLTQFPPALGRGRVRFHCLDAQPFPLHLSCRS